MKPEWLDDERMAMASLEARVLSVALVLMSDDYGNGRANPVMLQARVFPAKTRGKEAESALSELENMGFVKLYELDGQRYYSIRNWSKHQKVEKPGKPRVPSPPGDSIPEFPGDKKTYIIKGLVTGLFKIGSSADPVSRLAVLATGSAEQLALVCISETPEAEMHRMFSSSRVSGEWFRSSPELMSAIAEAGGDVENPIVTTAPRILPESSPNPPRLFDDESETSRASRGSRSYVPGTGLGTVPESGSGARTKKRGDTWRFVPDDWKPKEKHQALASKLNLDLDSQADAYRNHEFKTPRSDADRAFSAWLHKASTFARPAASQQKPRNVGEELLIRAQQADAKERNLVVETEGTSE